MSSPPLATYVETDPDADGPGPASAALVFRLGVADTDYLQHGQLHVLLRLVSSAAGHLPVQRRALVGAVTSSVAVTGAPDDVAEALEAMASWLNDPDWSERRTVTAQVLAEDIALGGADDELAAAALSRWGRRGVGLIGLAPAGLARSGIEQLDTWRREHLTAGNSCLVADHPSMGELGLQLPPGPAVPPDTRSGLALPLPALTARVDREGAPISTRHGSATITALTRQPAATRVLAGILTTRLNTREGAVGARTRTRALPVGGQLLWLYEHGTSGPDEVYAALRDVAHGEVDADELDATVRRLSGVPRRKALARAERQALSDMWGVPGIRDLGEVTVEEAVAEARAAVPTVLMLGDRTGDGDAALRLVQGPNHVPPGRVRDQFRSRRRSSGVLTLSEHTCEVTAGEARQVVSWQDLVAVQHLGPTRRVLVPRYGPALTVDAARWRDGGRAVAAVDTLAPFELVVAAPEAVIRTEDAPSGAASPSASPRAVAPPTAPSGGGPSSAGPRSGSTAGASTAVVARDRLAAASTTAPGPTRQPRLATRPRAVAVVAPGGAGGPRGRRRGGPPPRRRLAHLERRQALDRGVGDLHAAHHGPGRTGAAPLHERPDRVGVTLDVGADAAVGLVDHPAGDPEPLGLLPARVAVEHALDPSVDHEPSRGCARSPCARHVSAPPPRCCPGLSATSQGPRPAERPPRPRRPRRGRDGRRGRRRATPQERGSRRCGGSSPVWRSCSHSYPPAHRSRSPW